ncbi:hypothetical protein M9H77_31963 [Catharanthus roseus]|uniref:Uncharacterized protein n=1 Tax=Catharanthus roseus TaxID=4058 RepID=A0ACC0A1Z9_CATRO|nr:hypothetical protein M9H77_31963 [Catharanthus roseus]
MYLGSSVTYKLYLLQPTTKSIKLHIYNGYVVMGNGLIKVTLSNPGGMVTGIEYNGIDNVLDVHQKESRRGYWDVVWDRPSIKGAFEQIQGTNFKVIAQDEDKIELSFKKTYDHHDTSLPLNIDKRFIMLRGESGFYTYAIFERLEDWPEFHIGEARVAFKLREKLFNYMAVSDTIQRLMPTNYDRERGHRLDYKEAVVLTRPKDSRFEGEVDDKYQYSKDNKDNHLHGWICPKNKVGFWVIIPSDEFRTGGPFKQELTSHVGPTALAVFDSHHYAGETLTGLKFKKGEPWKKVFGPVFIYLNSNSDSEEPHEALWKDAKNQMEIETKRWPYDFPVSIDFPHADQRGSVNGRLLINDRYIDPNRRQFPAKSAYVGLAPPGDEGSWQLDGKGYQFWNQTDEQGYFNITGIRQGNYNLFAWVPTVFGDYKYEAEIEIKRGSEINLGNLVFTPPRNGPTLWEIGISDRTAAEFYIPDPIPSLRNYLFDNHTDKWRQYGLWNQYADLYPNQDLLYTVGVSDYSKDWFFAHVNRKVSDNEFEPTTWRIQFDLDNVIRGRSYTLRLALASADYAHLQIRVNRENSPRPPFSTGGLGRDNAIARHGIHGLYWPFSFDIPWYMLVQGRNTIFLKQVHALTAFNGIMYDYLRLEEPLEF